MSKPTGTVHEIRLKPADHPPQLQSRDWVWARCLVPAAGFALDPWECPQLAQAPHREAIRRLARRQRILPHGHDAELMPTLRKPEGHRPCLALNSSDERRIVIADEQNAQASAS